MLLAEQDDEWQDGRRYFQRKPMALIDTPADREEVPGATHRELTENGAKVTSCYTTSWDLTCSLRPYGVRAQTASQAICTYPLTVESGTKP